MVEYVARVWPLMVNELEMDENRRGTAAMLCCACRALELKNQGKSWDAAQIMAEYGAMNGITKDAVKRSICRALGNIGVGAVSALHWLVDNCPEDGDSYQRFADTMTQIGDALPGIVTDYGYCGEHEKWIRYMELSERMQCEYSQNGLCEYCIYWKRHRDSKGWRG